MSSLSRRSFVKTASAAAATIAIKEPVIAEIAHREASSDLKLWFETPASQWVDALPIGNGSLGAMVYGGSEHADPAQAFA